VQFIRHLSVDRRNVVVALGAKLRRVVQIGFVNRVMPADRKSQIFAVLRA
jgi:hypothetical protein